MYYAIIENGILNGTSETRQIGEDIINFEISKKMYDEINLSYENNEVNKYIFKDNDIIQNPDYEAEVAQERRKQFETEFFNTSLGYIRRKVTMANGDTKDFLTDLLPSIAMGIQLKQPVSVITYKEPDFTEEITDLVKYQEVKQATAEFVQECFMQLNNDFLPPKVEEDLNSGETSDTEGEKPI